METQSSLVFCLSFYWEVFNSIPGLIELMTIKMAPSASLLGTHCHSSLPLGNGSTPEDKFHTLLECDGHVLQGGALRKTQDTLNGLRLWTGLGFPLDQQEEVTVASKVCVSSEIAAPATRL